MSEKSKATTFLLCFFFGALGIHRFYLGKFITGLLMFLTLGGLGIWAIVDLVLIVRDRLGDKEGNDLYTGPPDPSQPNAGFWARFAAITVDSLILLLIGLLLVYLPMMVYLWNAGVFTASDPEQAVASLGPMVGLFQGVPIIISVLYFVGLTASKRQGTIGKRCFEIYVRKRDGGRVWIGHSLVRYVGYIISWIPLGLGYLMVAFHKNKLGLHDLIAGTEVVYGRPGEAAVAQVDHDAVTEVRQEEPAVAAFSEEEEEKVSRVPEILVGAGLLLILGSVAFAYLR